MKEISLTRGKVALVDDDDYEWLIAFKWHAIGSDKYGWYAACIISGSTVEMHRFIMGRPEGMEVDHADRNSLNNTRRNLRVVTHAQNVRNRRIQQNNKSGFRGVYLHQRDGRWIAQIKFNGKYVYLGCFRNAVDAAKAYDSKAVEVYGEFAQPNFPDVLLTSAQVERLRVRRYRKGKGR